MAAKKQARKGQAQPGDDCRDQNVRRAEWARAALSVFQNEARQDDSEGLDTVLTDLLCDLLHLCGKEGLEFERVLVLARRHYDAETRDASDGPEIRP